MIDILDIAMADIAAEQISKRAFQAFQERKLREFFSSPKIQEIQSGGIAQPYVEFSSVMPVTAEKRQEQAKSAVDVKFELIAELRGVRSQVNEIAHQLLKVHEEEQHIDENDPCVQQLSRLEADYVKLGEAMQREYGECDKLLAIVNAQGRVA